VAIVEGLQAGEKVVRSGQLRLQPGSTVRITNRGESPNSNASPPTDERQPTEDSSPAEKQNPS
jgi:hypothetical protein